MDEDTQWTLFTVLPDNGTNSQAGLQKGLNCLEKCYSSQQEDFEKPWSLNQRVWETFTTFLHLC